jgi:hypothetical protein
MNLEEYAWYDAFGLADVVGRGALSAAAVAAGIASVSRGADGAGSIKAPAAASGAQRAV